MGTKFLITGGAGFIGREVVKQLLKEGNKIVVIDNLSFGRLENIKEFKNSPNFKFYKEDILNYDKIKEIIMVEKAKIAIHLAALHYIPYCNEHQDEAMNVNVNATYQLFFYLAKAGIEKILFASSGAIYASEESELVENKDLPQPVDIYGLTKLLGENICEYFSRNFKLKITAMRFFNTYGPYETNPHLIPEIIKQLKAGNYNLLLGNIKTKRDYIYVEDLANAICELSLSKDDKLFEIINIGTGLEHSAEEIIECIERLIGKKINILIDQNRIRKNDKMHQIASLDLAKAKINWRPKYKIDEGLKKLLTFENLLDLSKDD